MTERERDELLLEMKDKLGEHDELLLEMKDKLGEHDELLTEMQKEIRSISGSVAVIEHVHGDKIAILGDGVKGVLEKLDSFEKRFNSNEDTLENHSIRIMALESKVNNS